jgi:HD-GYP domain-containing protein (c-di-GMP phosphodiesterase class II)
METTRKDMGFDANAQDVISQLSVILRTAKIHDPENIAVTTAIERFLLLINAMIESELSVTLELRGEFFHINGMRIRYSINNIFNYNSLIREFKKIEIGKVIFRNIVSSEDMQLFLKTVIKAGFSDAPYEKMLDFAEKSNNIGIDRIRKITEGEETDVRKIIKKTYFGAVSYIKGVMANIRAGERINIRKAKRIMETMVDHLLDEEQLLLSMTAIKNYDEYTYHHSVNVSILSIALGQRLGLRKKMLTELGLVALLHDIGKIEIPEDILNKPSAFTDDEWRIVQRHPIWGLRALLKLRELDSTTMRSSIVAFEHHMNCDFSGYPKVNKYTELDLFSKIISIADKYDAITSSRVYSRNALAPDKALSVMIEGAGKQLDPLLFKFFVNMVGVFPVGTLVMLDTKELGLVYESEAVFADRPRVLIILDSTGKKIRGPVVNLTEKDKAGKYYRSIVKTLDPYKYNINLAEYLL